MSIADVGWLNQAICGARFLAIMVAHDGEVGWLPGTWIYISNTTYLLQVRAKTETARRAMVMIVRCETDWYNLMFSPTKEDENV